jgi:hypothetical protein
VLKVSAHSGIAFDSTCNTLVKIAANDVARARKTEQFIGGTLGCPREIASRRDQKEILKYVLLEQAVNNSNNDASNVGLISVLREVLENGGVRSSFRPSPPPVAVTYIMLMFALYIMCAFVYCVAIVGIGHMLCGSSDCVIPFLGSFVFPGATDNLQGATTSVILDYYIFSVQIALPFLIGVTLYERKKISSSQSISFSENIIPVAGMQVIWALFGACFGILTVSLYQKQFDFFNLWNLLQLTISLSFAPIVTVIGLWVTNNSFQNLLWFLSRLFRQHSSTE